MVKKKAELMLSDGFGGLILELLDCTIGLKLCIRRVTKRYLRI